MGALVHHRAVAPTCLAAPHLSSVPAAGAAADAFPSALTTNDCRNPWSITSPAAASWPQSRSAPPQVERAFQLVNRWIEAKTALGFTVGQADQRSLEATDQE